MAVTNFEVYATRLRDDRLNIKLKQTIAHELCESLEFSQLQDYTRFVAVLWPVIRDLLLKTSPVFVSTSPEQRLRSTLLEIIQRIPHSEVFRPIVQEVVTTLVTLVKIENEENAVVCLKIIYELHRMYRQLLENVAQPFLELASELYCNSDQMLKLAESMDTPASLSTPNASLLSPSAMSPGPDSGDSASKNLSKAAASFKVLTEVPIIVVSIIQANRRHAEPFVTNILPHILHMLELGPKTNHPAQQHPEATSAYGRSAYADLITAQSKTLSFLAFFARGFTALLLPFQDRIAQLTLHLLCVCPAESTATRKEMLIATRHIVSTEIRKAFVPIADKFLDMQVLVGTGLASQCILKPFAFSMLADLMHHIRSELSPAQLTRMVDFYAGCMHDQSLSSGVHTMCAKLLHNITECIMLIPDKRHGRVLLLSILRTFVSSFAAIGGSAAAAIDNARSGNAYSEDKLYGGSEMIRTNAFEQGDRIKELRFLLRSLVTGCKNVMYALRKCDSTLALGMHHQAQGAGDEANAPVGLGDGTGTRAPSMVANQEAELAGFELDLLKTLFREGLRACRIHDVERVRAETAARNENKAQPPPSRETQIKLLDREGKEQIDHFANLFINLDLAVFHELFTSQFDFAFQAMVEHCAAVSSVQVFVAYDATSPAFISIMLRYLCDNLDLLGSDDEALTSTMLHMFKIAFLALAFFPEANEPVLQPYVQPIISSALVTSKTAKRPENYFLLLRALFRSIGGGRYETLYKEVFPVLQSLLEMLNGALGFTKSTSPVQELFVEICLTVPVRLSVLLPYLSLLMKPLVFALESGPELVSQGLRTLELCIDNLTREFLDPILTPVMDEIMASLWLHLRLSSSTSTHAPVAARILGKLGGRNRHMLLTRVPAYGRDEPRGLVEGFEVPLTFEGLSGLVTMPLSDAVSFSIRVLENREDMRQLGPACADAIEFVVACARYALAAHLPAGHCHTAHGTPEGAMEYGQQLIALVSHPLAQKRLANISSPTTQGCQLFEQAIGSNASIGNTCAARNCLASGEAAIAAVAASTSQSTLSLDELQAGGRPSITRAGLTNVIWALSLASSRNQSASELLKAIISHAARQHVAQCVYAINPEAQADERTAPCAAMLAAVIPEIISRMLVAQSEGLVETKRLMLRHFYSALCDLLPNNAALVGHLPAMRRIVSDLCAACYDPDTSVKRGGCVGIAFAVQVLDLGHTWLTENLLELSKGLLFTLKDINSNAVQHVPPADSRATLLDIIKLAFPPSIFASSDADELAAMDIDRNGDEDGGREPGAAHGVGGDSADRQLSKLDTDEAQETDAFDFSKPLSGSLVAPAGNSADASPAKTSDMREDAVRVLPGEGGAASVSGTTSGGDGGALPTSGTVSSVDACSSAVPVSDVKTSMQVEKSPSSADRGLSNSSANQESDKPQQNSPGDLKPASPGGVSLTDAAAAASVEADVVDASAAGSELGRSSVNEKEDDSSTSAASLKKTQLVFQRLTARLSPENSRLLRSFLALITKELANPSTAVRETVKACLEILAGVTGCSTTALLLPSRDRLLVPIFSKPLRALPHNMQIGNIDAITYCLSLDPPFLDINEELLRLLSEALALADAEDQALVNHPAQVHSNTASLTHLRHVCIRMLTAAMVRPEFADAKNTPTRARIISVFFKSLYHKSVEVVDAANDGLKQVLLQQQKLPRDLLQTGLRPILINLSDYKRLTVASLDGLARLLQLLTNYFKVEVGRKLLDHMQQWANPQLLQSAAERPVEDMHEIKILVAILQVFHLLPPSASVLLDDLVSSVVNLEVHLCRRESSPFRTPLFKFLNRYPTESVVYFVERIESVHYARIFCHAIASPECGPLRDALIGQTPLLVALLKGFCAAASASKSDLAAGHTDAAASSSDLAASPGAEPVLKRLNIAMSATAVIHACLEHAPLWFEDRVDLLHAMLDSWAAAGRLVPIPSKSSYLARPVLIEHVIHSLLLATRAMDNPPAMLFRLLDAAGRSSESVDVSFVFRYVWDTLIVRWPASKRREVLLAFLPRLTDPGVSDESNAILLQHLINPMVATVFTLPNSSTLSADADEGGDLTAHAMDDKTQDERGAELLRGPVLPQIHQRVWVAHMSSGPHPLPASNAAVRLELIQLSSILIRRAAVAVAEMRKDIIKFGWLFIRNDDIMIKNASYVLVAQFIAAFETPPKIILQAYSTLLKAHQVESRFLVRQALDILLPVLPVRLGQHPAAASGASADVVAAGGPVLPPWAMLVRRILIDNSASLAHTTHVYQLIAGHPAIFFPYRTQFASTLVGVLQKMCLTHSATSETRTLALDIMELFLKWEGMLDSDIGAANEAGSDQLGLRSQVTGGSIEEQKDASGTTVSAPSISDALLPEARRETIVGLLLRMLCLVFDFALKTTLGPRALDLLSRYLDASRWPPMHLRLTFFERSIQQIEAQGMNQQLVLHVLNVLSVVTSQMQSAWFEEYFEVLVGIVRKCMIVDNSQVQKIVASMLHQLYEQAANNEHLDSSPVVADLRAHVEALVGRNLQDNTSTYGTLLILHAVGDRIGEQFYSYIPLLMKYVQKYTKEHNAHAPASSLNSHIGPTPGSSSLQPSSSTPVMPTLAADNGSTSAASNGVSGAGQRVTNSSTEIINRVFADGQIPLTVDALIKGETPLDLLLMLLLLLRKYISRLGDQRRSFLTYIIQLIERSSDPALLHVILAIVREWVLDPQDAFPTIKEKAMLMSSMMCFVRGSASANDNASRASVRASAGASGSQGSATSRGIAAGNGIQFAYTTSLRPEADANDPFSLLERKYLSLVLEVYNDPRFTRSEMTMRLEQAFLSGMQCEDSEMRSCFLETFNANMPPSLPVRLNYLLETQSWESVSSTFWLQQCLPLLFASTHQRAALRPFAADRAVTPRTISNSDITKPTLVLANSRSSESASDTEMEMDIDTDIGVLKVAETVSKATSASMAGHVDPTVVGDIVGPLAKMVLLDVSFAYRIWVVLFPLLWHNLGSKERHDLNSGIIRLLAKPYHQSQTAVRPNVIQAILEGFCACDPMPRLPPQLLRYLGQSYSAWYSSLALLERKLLDRREVESVIFERTMGVELGAFDALTELYTSLSANHYFYGAWKRHCQYWESHIALAYEQLDDWANAQAAYERAQTKARAGYLPFSESEYCLWETRWVESTKRLQSWDMLLDLGLHESLPEIELEAGWRVWDWNERQTQALQLIKATTSEFSSSPRAKFYETYLTLIKTGTERTKSADFQRMCKEGIKSCLQQWNELPPIGTPAHLEVLHLFQLMVELGDASNIYTSLATTKAENLESKSGDLKSVLQTWRERLPNNSDPINIWSDLVAWRQHIFKAINDVYVPFITQQSAAASVPNDGSDGPVKGANKTKSADSKSSRKSGAGTDADEDLKADEEGQRGAVPGSGTSSVPTSYAYRGYHEMAWIINRFAHVARLHGLVDVCISSLTRIYTLPNIEIQEAFLKLREQAKCYYHRSQELQSGLDVISNTNLMYFSRGQKAEFFTLKGQFLAKLGKLEEANHAFATGAQLELSSPKAWAAWGRYNDECFCRNMPDPTGAVNAISCYMQAAGLCKRPRVRRFLARTLWLLSQDDASGKVCAAFDAYNGEMPTWYWIALVPQLLAGLDASYSRQVQQILLRMAKQYPQALYYALRTAREDSHVLRRQQPPGTESGHADTTATTATAAAHAQPAPAIDELMLKLKTAHPLLTLSMEAMIDQILHRLKPCPEEDMYRLVRALLLDGLQQLHQHISQGKLDLSLISTIVSNTCRVGLSLPSGIIKSRFEADFGGVREMDLCEYITKMYQWQQMLRQVIKQRPRKLMLGLFSPFLVEFEQQKFEDVEVPGQYLRLSDSSDDFVRIERFIPELRVVLGSSGVLRNLAIRGTDGGIVHFSVQHFTSRYNHQEERWVQFYRNLDAAGEHDRNTWEQRRIALHLPTIVSLSPHIRLVQEQPDSYTLQDVYDESCSRRGVPEIAPALHAVGKIRDLIDQLPSVEAANEVLFEQISQRLVPESLLQSHVGLHTASPMEFWLYRENFSYQISVSIALTYMIACTQRIPAKLDISRATGNICMHDLIPTQATPGLMHSQEAVPFRLTPNIQSFVTELGLEGIVPFAIHKVGQRFMDTEHLLRDFLDLFVRDELVHSPPVRSLSSTNSQALAEMCERNVRLIEHRAGQLVETLPPKDVREKERSPMQPLIQLMMQAVAPSNLAKMDFAWMPWL
ncbi:transcription-associated protein 1 [Coemansia sp. RSA 1365]|nr:transcription-associated protein 1 [Coemansia sp. RSA 1365]